MPDRCERFMQCSPGRWAGILVVVISLCMGCGGEQGRPADRRASIVAEPARPDSSPSTTIAPYEYIPDEKTYQIRDLVRGVIYTVEYVDEFLTLRSDSTILDTLTLFGVWCDSYEFPHFTQFDSTFLVYEAVCKGNSASGSTEIYCVADGQFRRALEFDSHAYHNVIYGSEYLVKPRLLRNPYRLRLTESFRVEPVPSYAKTPSFWKRHYQLRFDTADHFFYSDSIRLVTVPIRREQRTISGAFPGVAFVGGDTRVLIDSQWYSLWSGDSDEEDYIHGRSKAVTSGRGDRGDTLQLWHLW